MVFGGDGSTTAFGLANRPILIEGRSALDRGFVGAYAQVDIVCSSVGGDRALVLEAARGIVSAEVLHDVVLDERARGPAVNGKVTIAIRLIGGGEGD